LGLSYRQTKRVWRRYRLDGHNGLVHGVRGKPGKRATPAALKQRILACYEERYPDFEPTLPAEYLPLKAWSWITRPCAGGVWPRASPDCAAAASGTDNGANANPALEPWCNWTVRITTGLKDAGRVAC
jgi:hypothetical protein